MKAKKIITYYLLPFFAVIIFFSTTIGATFSLISLKIAKVEFEKITLKLAEFEKHNEQLNELKIELLKAQYEKDAKEIIEFHELYAELKKDYDMERVLFSEKLSNKFVSINEIKELNEKRIKEAENLKNNLMLIEFVPESLKEFFDWNIELVDIDIRILKLINLYYDSLNYSNYDDSTIKQMVSEKEILLEKIETKMKKVYSSFGVEFLLDN